MATNSYDYGEVPSIDADDVTVSFTNHDGPRWEGELVWRNYQVARQWEVTEGTLPELEQTGRYIWDGETVWVREKSWSVSSDRRYVAHAGEPIGEWVEHTHRADPEGHMKFAVRVRQMVEASDSE